MEIQDGFIVGIDNYCDRWCQACALTSRCRSFATMAEVGARIDTSMKTAALFATQEQAAGVMEQLASVEMSPVPPADTLAQLLKPEHRPIEARAKGYAFRAARWLKDHREAAGTRRSAPTDPIERIERYRFFILGKTFRALSNVALADGDEDLRDADGSAKSALVGIERSRGAWLELVGRGRLPADACLADLAWLGAELERVFPHARAFVRPGLDEPEAVKELDLRV